MAKSIVSTSVDNGRLTITVDGFAPIVIDPAEMPDNLNAYAALHGYKQKLVDAAAIERDPDTGRPATPAHKYAAIMAVHDHMVSTGEWNRTGGGDGSGSDGLLVRALVEYLGQSVETVRATVAAWDKRTQAAMRGDPAVAPIIARLRMARDATKAKGIDTAGLLASLRG
jgi:hypothetical protein